jgi:NlpC/P60 family putative phage cell wall peptidase
VITGEQIAAEARAWLGTPFQHHACMRGVACDCIGLVAGVALALGVAEAPLWLADAEFRGYTPTPNPEKLTRAVRKYLDPVSAGDVAQGDVLLFTFTGEPMHFAILAQATPRPMMVHGYQIAGRVIENGLDAKWRRRIVGAFRYRGVA